ncbi:Histone deacetylase 7 [Homalodisca vitripennis]|nr:Histone deacetylase 7 [Homalodisca vitripennis]
MCCMCLCVTRSFGSSRRHWSNSRKIRTTRVTQEEYLVILHVWKCTVGVCVLPGVAGSHSRRVFGNFTCVEVYCRCLCVTRSFGSSRRHWSNSRKIRTTRVTQEEYLVILHVWKCTVGVCVLPGVVGKVKNDWSHSRRVFGNLHVWKCTVGVCVLPGVAGKVKNDWSHSRRVFGNFTCVEVYCRCLCVTRSCGSSRRHWTNSRKLRMTGVTQEEYLVILHVWKCAVGVCVLPGVAGLRMTGVTQEEYLVILHVWKCAVGVCVLPGVAGKDKNDWSHSRRVFGNSTCVEVYCRCLCVARSCGSSRRHWTNSRKIRTTGVTQEEYLVILHVWKCAVGVCVLPGKDKNDWSHSRRVFGNSTCVEVYCRCLCVARSCGSSRRHWTNSRKIRTTRVTQEEYLVILHVWKCAVGVCVLPGVAGSHSRRVFGNSTCVEVYCRCLCVARSCGSSRRHWTNSRKIRTTRVTQEEYLVILHVWKCAVGVCVLPGVAGKDKNDWSHSRRVFGNSTCVEVYCRCLCVARSCGSSRRHWTNSRKIRTTRVTQEEYLVILHVWKCAELWEQQKALEEQQREQREKERLESLKKKEKHEQSAVASSEVKQRLQGFLLNKKHREAAAAANGAIPTAGQAFRNWSVLQGTPGDSNAPSNPTSSPYRLNPLLAKYDEDFPLRKTASEPNLLKVRLKQRVIERRASPIARRKDRHIKRKSQLAKSSGSNTDSGPNSPPVSQLSPPGGHNTPIQEEGEPQYAQLSTSPGSMNDLSGLYTSPSMPNISLGRPPTSTASESKLAPVSEAEVRAAFAARLGMPLTGQMLSGTLPYYPTLPVIEAAEYGSAAYTHKQMASLEQRGACLPSMYPHVAITDTQVAHARLNKQGHRPLGRTQSAPLPLGHPMLAAGIVLDPPPPPTHHPAHLSTHNLLRQQIRQTVLTRAGSRAQSLSGSQLDEAPEAEDLTEVIDLTEKDKKSEVEGESEICRQQRERESFLQQQRDLMMRHTLQVSEGSAFSPRLSHVVRPLSRALSSPLVALSPESGPVTNPPQSSPGHAVTTGLAYDGLMLKHACVCGDNSLHLEHGGRLQSVWARLGETGLVQRCDRVRSRKATLEELQVCHSEAHTLLFGTNPLNRQKLDMSKLSQLPIKSFVRLPCGGVGVDSDTTWNELHTGPAARMAVGCVVDLAFKTATGDVKNGMAVVRPPGHHAEASQAMGFCFFNSVAIATRLLQQRLDLRRILIVDWDVHHGNGTQQVFYDDHRVLYLSIHRHDDGNFFPGTGGPTECGTGAGLGFNVNVAWSGGLNPAMGDAEYLAAFRTIVMPIAKEFEPEVVMVSAGFDAATGHPPPLGGYKLSPACFGYMTQQLMQLAHGKKTKRTENWNFIELSDKRSGRQTQSCCGLNSLNV